MASTERLGAFGDEDVLQHTSRYIREVLHAQEAPPPITIRYFYTSPLAIDDPLSPLPPPASSSSTTYKQPPRPFSEYDNQALDQAWLDLRRKILKLDEVRGEKGKASGLKRSSSSSDRTNPRDIGGKGKSSSRETSAIAIKSRNLAGSVPRSPQPWSDSVIVQDFAGPSSFSGQSDRGAQAGSNPSSLGDVAKTLKTNEVTDALFEGEKTTTTGTPFIRAPSRKNLAATKLRPGPSHLDSYAWDDEEAHPPRASSKDPRGRERSNSETTRPTARVPVGVSRLHEVVMDEGPIRMEPIYWRPVGDIADIVRGTWFYKETMLPVEVEVANMLEAGFIHLRPWSKTWTDELNSAVEVGAEGEMKILHRLWPESKPRQVPSRPGTSSGGNMQSTRLDQEQQTPETERAEILEHACDLIDISTQPGESDNKACGSAPYGSNGKHRLYLSGGVIYANGTEAYILKPSLQPSAYYGRRPLANYIRKGRPIGISVVRGFDEGAWNKLHPPKEGARIEKAREGVSTSQAGTLTDGRILMDPSIAQSERPAVTDLVLVIHGIGQKLSERIESFHFTHAINAFRREVNVELGTDSVKAHLRPDGGGIMVLPINWRQSLSFEDGGYRDESEDDPAGNQYTLQDITPETLPSVRNIISDVMLDIPYYLSREHNPKMVAACTQEANRVYRLWCANNPGFSQRGRVHLIAHSLGSVMALDILSQQPSYVPSHLGEPTTPESELPNDHFVFDTKSLFLCGSPAGFFLLLKRAGLLPRRDREKPDADDSNILPGVAGERGTYGCLAVDNIYNIVNGYDPVAYRLNATVDTGYASALKTAFIPTSNTSFFAFRNPFKSSQSSAYIKASKPPVPRLPSNVELETHNFTREEIAEKRAYLLNDNGQIDFFLKYGGGALEIQYLTMLGAHSSYWLSKDFVRMIVIEVGRRLGKEGTVLAMRAQKKKAVGVP